MITCIRNKPHKLTSHTLDHESVVAVDNLEYLRKIMNYEVIRKRRYKKFLGK